MRILLLALVLVTQSAKPHDSAPVVETLKGTVVPETIQLDATYHTKVRDKQYEMDQLEIESQRLQVRIEQNRQKELQLSMDIRGLAYEAATEKKLDLKLYQFDDRAIQFIKTGEKK